MIKEMEKRFEEMEKNVNQSNEKHFMVLGNLRDENDQMQKTIEVTNELVKKLESEIYNKSLLISEQESIIIELNNNLQEYIKTTENQDGLLNTFKAQILDRNKEIAKVTEKM